jgi:Na+/phosphate symporter
MTYEGMFNEYDDSIELKKLRKENNQLKKTIDILQTDNDIKDYEIQILKGKLNEQKNKNTTR